MSQHASSEAISSAIEISPVLAAPASTPVLGPVSPASASASAPATAATTNSKSIENTSNNTNKDTDVATGENNNDPPSSPSRPSSRVIVLTMAPLCLSVLLSALDLTIITPAIPAIVATFNSTAGYVWIGSAFVLASTAITPVWGSVADIWGRKPIMLLSMAFFLAGSLLCALAPQMGALIAGRAVQGLGASGMGTMVNVIICDTFSPRDRGLYLAITSVVWAVGSAVGPVIGGSFTTRLE